MSGVAALPNRVLWGDRGHLSASWTLRGCSPPQEFRPPEPLQDPRGNDL